MNRHQWMGAAAGASLVLGLGLVGLAGGAAGWAAPGLAPADQTCAPAWRVALKAAPEFGRTDLQGIAAAGAAGAWAVGGFIRESSQTQTLIEHWDGAHWRLVASPNTNPPDHPVDNELRGVAVAGPQDIWAVGAHLAITTTGGTRAPGRQTLIEHGDGTAWTIVPSPNHAPDKDNVLVTVAAGGPDDVWAAGSVADGGLSEPLIVHWDGTAWRELPVPSPAGPIADLHGLAVAGPADVWAVGAYAGTTGPGALIEHWDGHAWSMTTLPSATLGITATETSLALTAVGVAGPNDVWAVGSAVTSGPPNTPTRYTVIHAQPIAVHWDGTRWTPAALPNPGTLGSTLAGLAVTGPADAWAVGSFTTDGVQQTLAMHWDGHAWKAAPSPNTEPTGNAFAGLAAGGADGIWAVGAGLIARYASPCAPPAPTSPTPTPAGPNPAAPVADPGDPAVTYFALTGHTLRGPFRTYWQQQGGLPQFGYPLTEEFVEPSPTDGRLYTVQYFERNRFEYHPELPALFTVSLGLLGQTLAAGREEEVAFIPRSGGPANARYFPATGHTLAAVFFPYWEAHGGLPVYGYPISEPFTEISPTDGQPYLVQYFERNRFEAHPELPPPFQVSLGLLGTQVLQGRGWLP